MTRRESHEWSGTAISEKPGLLGQVPEAGLGSGPQMGDDLSGTESTELSALLGTGAVGEPVEESGGIEVAGTGGVDDTLDGGRGNLDGAMGGDHHGSRRPPRQSGEDARFLGRAQRGLEAIGGEQRHDLDFVGEDQVELVMDE